MATYTVVKIKEVEQSLHQLSKEAQNMLKGGNTIERSDEDRVAFRRDNGCPTAGYFHWKQNKMNA
jgi:hypothetical protein